MDGRKIGIVLSCGERTEKARLKNQACRWIDQTGVCSFEGRGFLKGTLARSGRIWMNIGLQKMAQVAGALICVAGLQMAVAPGVAHAQTNPPPNHDPQLSCVSTEVAYYDQQISSSPDMTEDYVCRARLYMGKKEWDKAADDLDKAVDLNPKYASAFIWRGLLKGIRGESLMGMNDLNKAINLDDQNAFAYYQRGNLQIRRGFYYMAINDFDEAVKLDDTFADAYYARGLTNFIQNDWGKSVDDLTLAIDRDSGHVNAHALRALIYQLGTFAKNAIPDYEKLTELLPNKAAYYCELAVLYQNEKETKKSAQNARECLRLNQASYDQYVYNRGLNNLDTGLDASVSIADVIKDLSDRLTNSPNDTSLLAERAQAYLAQKQYERAIADLTKAIKLDPQSDKLYSLRAQVYIARGDARRMMADLDSAVQVMPKEISNYLMRGAVKFALKDTRGGLADLDKAVEIAPNNARVLTVRAGFLADMGKFDDARKDLERARKIDPENEAVHYVFALLEIAYARDPNSTQATSGMSLNRAEDDLTIAIAYNPLRPEYYYWRGFLTSSRGTPEMRNRSLGDMTQAIRLNPKWVAPLLDRGYWYLDDDQLDKASMDAEKALQLEPKNEDVLVLRASIRLAKGDLTFALDDINQALKIDAKYAYAYCMRGSINAQMNRKPQAISDYRLCRTYSTTTGLKNMAESALAKLGAK